MFRSVLVACVAAALAAIGSPAGADTFSRSAYIDITAKRQLPPPARGGPLAAVARYLGAMPDLDRRRILVEVLLDRKGRRVFRIRRICKSAERCGDDSVAETREALDLRQGRNGRWSIVWVGSQVRCHKGRGHQDWSNKPCV